MTYAAPELVLIGAAKGLVLGETTRQTLIPDFTEPESYRDQE